jgi:hypothetical protein
MKRKSFKAIAVNGLALLVGLGAAWQASKTPYPNMAPVEQYMMARDAEIALARSAAPESISRDAEVMVMGRHGYETAVKGKNGFACIVERSRTAGIDDPDCWDPKLRGPICFNPPAARTYLPLTIRKTGSVLAGGSKAQMFEDIRMGFEKKELPALEVGAMCYMMSKPGVFERSRRALASARNVFCSGDGRCDMGCKYGWLADCGSSGRGGSADYFYDSGWRLVGRYSGTFELAPARDFRGFRP